MVGDGRSDFCIAENSHLVLARRAGLRLIAGPNTQASWPIEDFSDATMFLSDWLTRNTRRSA